MDYGLPKTVEICGEDVPVRYDYRVILDIFEVFNSDISDNEKAIAALYIFYPGFPELPDAPDYRESMEKMNLFINGGKSSRGGSGASLVSWENDYPYICSAVNRVLGYEIRAVEYDQEANTGGVHWYTFLAAYMEIGECFFSQIVGIRAKKHKHKKLDKSDQDFYRANKELIDSVDKLNKANEDWLAKII